MKHTCVQCGKEFGGEKWVSDVMGENIALHYCINKSCPNYALVAIPLEQMPITEEKE